MESDLAGTKRSGPEKTPEKVAKDPKWREEKKGELSPYQVCVVGIPKFTTEHDLYKNVVLPLLPNPEGAVVGISKQAIREAGYILFSSAAHKEAFIAKFHELNRKLKYQRARVTALVHKPLLTNEFRPLKDVVEKTERRKYIELGEAQQLGTDDNQVLPWRDIPYPEQVEKKTSLLQNAMTHYLQEMRALQGGVAVDCTFLTMFSDENNLSGYRNKVEMSVGLDLKGEIEIGFVKGKMETRKISIESAQGYPHISAEAKEVATKLLPIIKSFNASDKLAPHNRISGEAKGYWRLLQVRQSRKNRFLMITVVCTKDFASPEAETKVQTALKEAYPIGGKIGEYSIVGLCMIHNGDLGGTDYNPADTVEVLSGTGHYMEEILGYKFQVSPLSFLQINPVICEKMYSHVRKLAEDSVKKGTQPIVFDLYCGIGTIGICLSQIAAKIVGIETVAAAIENAKLNAELNGLKDKTEYICGKAEDHMGAIAQKYGDKNTIVAVVDPPRCGLHKTVVQKMRTCKGLDVIIYVSCNPQSMIRDITYLCRPNQGKVKGPPFTAVNYAGADLFPYTPHTECIVLLKRLYYGSA